MDQSEATAFAKIHEVSFIAHLVRSRSPAYLVSVSDFQTMQGGPRRFCVVASRQVPDFLPFATPTEGLPRYQKISLKLTYYKLL